jgi:hypothetical protein
LNILKRRVIIVYVTPTKLIAHGLALRHGTALLFARLHIIFVYLSQIRRLAEKYLRTRRRKF